MVKKIMAMGRKRIEIMKMIGFRLTLPPAKERNTDKNRPYGS